MDDGGEEGEDDEFEIGIRGEEGVVEPSAYRGVR